MGVRESLGRGKRTLKSTLFWIRHELPKAPRLELYTRRLDRDNRHLTKRLREGGTDAFQAYVSPYLDRDIPRILWIFWAQGEDAAPPVVKKCIASWRRHNPDWDIRILDAHTAQALTMLPDLPDNLPFRFKSNLLRLNLLARHGGVWADATTYCHRPLDQWIHLLGGQTGFFVFSAPHTDRWIDNWFIASDPENPLVTAWRDAYRTLLTRARTQPSKYFMMIYVLQWRLINSPDLMAQFRRRGSLPAVPCFLLQGALEGKIGAETAVKAIERGLPLSKLSHKAVGPEGRLDDLLARIRS